MAPVTRRYLVLVCGCSASAYGTYLNLIAVGLFSYHETGSSVATGGVMAARLAAGFLAGLGSGRLLAGLTLRFLLIGTQLAQAAVLVALALVSSVGMLAVVAVVLGASNTVFQVALRSSIPDLVGSAGRVRANGQLVTGRSVATVLGFGSAAMIIDRGGFAMTFLVNAASFLVAAATVAVVSLPGNPSHPPQPAERVRHGWWRALPPVVLAMIMLRGADALGSAAHNVALPIYASTAVPGSPAAFLAMTMATWAAGNLLAHQWLAHRSTMLGQRGFAAAICVMSASFVLMFVGLPTAPLIAVSLLAGLADGIAEITYVSCLQTAPAEARGRLFGWSASWETSGLAAGMVTSSVLLEALPAAAVVGVFQGAAFATAGGFLLLSGKGELRWGQSTLRRSAEDRG